MKIKLITLLILTSSAKGAEIIPILRAMSQAGCITY
jgi:hypothetical protein